MNEDDVHTCREDCPCHTGGEYIRDFPFTHMTNLEFIIAITDALDQFTTKETKNIHQ